MLIYKLTERLNGINEMILTIGLLLKEEWILFNNKEYGFWCNFSLICKNIDNLYIMEEQGSGELDARLIGICLVENDKIENYNPSILWIRPHLRRKGYGREFVEYFEDKTCDESMIVHIVEDSRGFWEKLGYKIVGNRFLKAYKDI